MGMTTTHGLPYPEDDDTPDVPRDIKALAEAVDEKVTQGLLQSATLVPGTSLFGSLPTASSNFLVQAGTVIVDPTSATGTFTITWPRPFTATLLTVLLQSGDQSVGSLVIAPNFTPGGNWTIGNLTSVECKAVTAATGAAAANARIRVNWIALGW
jgi:hypothetical protein